jgi:nitrite reductase/ring-hydroxylating ferredoxin subunit
VRADRAAGSYVSATVEGPGAGSEVRARLTALAPDRTGIEVEFHVPESDPARLAVIGGRYRTLYERLWDEDEAMMIERERAWRARRADRAAPAETVLLGPPEAVRASLPRLVKVGGERFRIVEVEGEMVVHAATCPHWLGPLDAAEVIDGCIRCPWHGYVFDVHTGESRDDRGLTLATPPRLAEIDGQLALVPA